MMRPATLRKGGDMMITITVKHHIARQDIVHVLLLDCYDDDRKPSRASVERALRERLAYKGRDSLWGDEVDEDQHESRTAWAEEHADRLFPEL